MSIVVVFTVFGFEKKPPPSWRAYEPPRRSQFRIRRLSQAVAIPPGPAAQVFRLKALCDPVRPAIVAYKGSVSGNRVDGSVH